MSHLIADEFRELIEHYRSTEEAFWKAERVLAEACIPRYREILEAGDEERARLELKAMPSSIVRALMASAFIEKFGKSPR